MKTKKVKNLESIKTLTLNKSTIVNLDAEELRKVKGQRHFAHDSYTGSCCPTITG